MLDLSRIDLWIVVIYMVAMLVVGFWVSSSSRDVEGYTVGNRKMNGWVVGMSVLGTFLSSITFLGLPASTYEGNWNAYVFGMALPIAALIAVVWFVPLYRGKANRLSAYELLEERFGYWARLYADIAYTLLQMIRIGMVLLLVAFAVEPMLTEPVPPPAKDAPPVAKAEAQQEADTMAAEALTGINDQGNLPIGRLVAILVGTGLLVIVYDTIGGIQAVIWTDVLQVIVLTLGAGWCLWVMIGQFESVEHFFAAIPAAKLSLGGWTNWNPTTGHWDWGLKTALVVLIYGITENTRNYGIDQNYVQRMFTAKSTTAANISIWFGALTYLPLSAVFCLIGTGLSLYYAEGLGLLPSGLKPDQVFPYFIQTALPKPVSGIVIAGILAAAMSTVDSCLNSCSTVIFTDVLRRLKLEPKNIPEIYLLRGCTILLGVIGTGVGAGLLIIYGSESRALMDMWWQYAGTAGGGLFGLFLLAWLMPQIPGWSAFYALLSTAPVLLWGTFMRRLAEDSPWKSYECPLHPNLVGVSATLVMVMVGGVFALLVRAGWFKPNPRFKAQPE